jgi:hypothetical protein
MNYVLSRLLGRSAALLVLALAVPSLAFADLNDEQKLAPTANAGLDQVITLPVNSVTLNGSASNDPDGTITAVVWSLVSGPNTPVIGAANDKITQVSGLAQGTYQFELKVIDDRGDSASDTITVTVNAAREKSCAPLKEIIALFEKLRETDPERFELFIKMFQFYPQVEAYFKQMLDDKVADLPVDKQIDFFASMDYYGTFAMVPDIP